jgi:hypothetical protein
MFVACPDAWERTARICAVADEQLNQVYDGFVVAASVSQ